MPSPIPLLLSPKTGGAFPGVAAAASPFTVPEGNSVALDTSSITWAVNAPASPATPAVFAVSDASGGAATRNITISGNGKTIDGAATCVLDKANEVAVFVYNGVQWNRVLPQYGFEGAALEPQRLMSSIADAIPPITLAGDVTGASASNLVAKLQGNPVVAPTPTNGQVLTWDTAALPAPSWVPATPTPASAINLRGTLAARPAFGVAGRLYFCTDSQAIWYDTGSAWTQVLQTLDQYGCAWLGQSVPATNRAGNFTTGQQFTVGRNCTCYGIRFYWATAGSAKTIRCTLWSNGGGALQTVDVAVNASGIYEGYFATPQTGLNAATFYRASIWETGGASYTAITQASVAAIIPRPSNWGGWLIANAITQNAAGNAIPTATAGTEFYTADPILVPV